MDMTIPRGFFEPTRLVRDDLGLSPISIVKSNHHNPKTVLYTVYQSANLALNESTIVYQT